MKQTDRQACVCVCVCVKPGCMCYMDDVCVYLLLLCCHIAFGGKYQLILSKEASNQPRKVDPET